MKTERDLELVWGAEAIASFIGRTARATFHMLEKGELPARKVGHRKRLGAIRHADETKVHELLAGGRKSWNGSDR